MRGVLGSPAHRAVRAPRPPLARQARIPTDSLRADGDDLLRAVLKMWQAAYVIAQRELRILQKLNKAAGPRASRVQTILEQAVLVIEDVQSLLEHFGRAVPAEVPAQRAELEGYIAELKLGQ